MRSYISSRLKPPMRSHISYLVCAFMTFNAHAGTIIALQNQEAIVSINEDLGSIVQLPSAVSTVTSSKYFYITDMGSKTDPESGVKTDVRTFQVKPVLGAKSENVTFVLANGKNISFKFTPNKEGAKFYDVHFEQTKKIPKSFFSQEMLMIKSMILDEIGGYTREVTNEKITTQFEKLEFKLTRIYVSNDFTGYVFEVTNDGHEKQQINLSKISFGFTNRAIMAHVDREELATCPLLSVIPDCTTRLHVLTRGNQNQPISILSAPPPFVKTDDVTASDL